MYGKHPLLLSLFSSQENNEAVPLTGNRRETGWMLHLVVQYHYVAWVSVEPRVDGFAHAADLV